MWCMPSAHHAVLVNDVTQSGIRVNGVMCVCVSVLQRGGGVFNGASPPSAASGVFAGVPQEEAGRRP